MSNIRIKDIYAGMPDAKEPINFLQVLSFLPNYLLMICFLVKSF